MTDPDHPVRGYAAPPCLAHEIDPAYVDPQQADDVARWRKAERARLLADRAGQPVAVRHAAAAVIGCHLDALLAQRFGSIDGLTISAWWPIKAELNLRNWLESLLARGARVALPVVEERAAPLHFRLWTPDCRMVQGVWKIPVPADGPDVTPDVTLAPVVGWDAAGYRLGYGGGYFDRTLAALAPRPLAIGVGLHAAQVPTIFPQPHDIAMDVVVTEAGEQKGTTP
ncbi:5-formyltetrahydrofolate cyclo-ligase [Gemmobacter megaterium]|uniref:5-formyltetrahydrofolate cyclo-ligase n=1 Tax=Gemmobacter megaterium TaxID=1086013 RepID=A0A1N7QR40_9RHOB|nr:5-formyltetrahydrofolate cyclo-ligase [Gemmobacter megaterium]GGE28854.1 5-formyltetrahydrofolate cyclo-ligase [Gemmobacter megaterium]SIT25266.1 5-formyltetrahydrofolate cyclo-ligase [Gemmobacter megaterium]